jgi:group I intron endonuclease
MLGKLYASPFVHYCTVFSFIIFPVVLKNNWPGTLEFHGQKLENTKVRLETRLNGGSLFPKTTKFAAPTGQPRRGWSLSSFEKLCFSRASSSELFLQDNPVPINEAPRQFPGVYRIKCLENGKSYYGESQNVSARLSQHKSRLRRNIHDVQELQNDFNLYGEKKFQFSVVSQNRNFSLKDRVALETELINSSSLCYNKFSRTSRKRENNPFWGCKHTPESIERISRSLSENNKNRISEGLPILLKGKTYPSISQASRETNHSRDTIRRWLNDPNNTDCVIQKSQKKEFQSNRVVNTGLAKPVFLYGKRYDSIADAARKRNCSRGNIQRLLRTHTQDCFILEN